MAVPALAPWRITTEKYFELAGLGVFEDERVELLDGVITPMSQPSPPHDWLVTALNRKLIEATDPAEHVVYPQATFVAGEGWVPQPDLFVVSADESDPMAWSTTAVLAVEVAWTSLHRDRVVKRPAYARAGVSEYWVVDGRGRRVVVHRDPRDGDYRDVTERSSGTLRTPLLPRLAVDLDDLWARGPRG